MPTTRSVPPVDRPGRADLQVERRRDRRGHRRLRRRRPGTGRRPGAASVCCRRPCGSWARRSTGVIDPGTGTLSWTIASTVPNCCRAAARSAATPFGPGSADVDPRVGRAEHALVGALHVDDEPEPDGGGRDRDGEQGEHSTCWRHSRRSSRQAQRRIARRAGAPPRVGRGAATGGGGGARVVLIAPCPRRAATPVPPLERSDRRSARRGGRSPGRPTTPAARRGSRRRRRRRPGRSRGPDASRPRR